jgi:hypothetical protein
MATLLKIVQDVLSSMDGDEVASISDTTEAMSVATIVETCYNMIVATDGDRETQNVFTLTAIGSTKPVLMQRPSNVVSIDWIKYDKREDGDPYPSVQYCNFLPIEQFLENMTAYLPSETDTDIGSFVQNVNGSNITFYYRKDKAPDYFTTFDDTYILFDSYDVDIEANLQESKTLGFGTVNTAFIKTDGFEIPFDFKTTMRLIEDSKTRASVELRQMENASSSKAARKLRVRSQFDNGQIGKTFYYDEYPNYGRKRP